MNILETLRNTLHPYCTAESLGLIGFFLWVFCIWCCHDEKTGWIKASFRATILIIMIGIAVGKIFG